MRTKRLFILFFIFILIFTKASYGLNDAPLNIYSDAAIIIENSTGKVLYEKNSEQKMYPASTTKILTAIIAIEKGNLKDEVTVSNTSIAEMKSGYSSAYLTEGEVISVENLLKVLLIHSANDASNVLAEYISGSIPEFVALMNSKAQELGCQNTHFVTTNGLHDDNHYTTAKDLVLIARYCMQNETFRNIVSTPKCTIPATNKSEARYYKNTNDMINISSQYYYNGCVGIKTGFTSQAKNCLISAANKNGLQLIAVVLGSGITDDNKSARYVDSTTLYDYAYSNFAFSTIANALDVVQTIDVKNATEETKSLDLILENDVSALINKINPPSVATNVTLNDNISAPIAANTVLGTVTYTVDNDTFTVNLLASHNVEKNNHIAIILRISLIIVFGFLVLFVIIKLLTRKKYPRYF